MLKERSLLRVEPNIFEDDGGSSPLLDLVDKGNRQIIDVGTRDAMVVILVSSLCGKWQGSFCHDPTFLTEAVGGVHLNILSETTKEEEDTVTTCPFYLIHKAMSSAHLHFDLRTKKRSDWWPPLDVLVEYSISPIDPIQ